SCARVCWRLPRPATSRAMSPRVRTPQARLMPRAAGGYHRPRRDADARAVEWIVILQGKRALIFGVANKRSIAWAIAQSLHREGAELAFTFQGDRVEPTVRDL